MGMGQQRTTSVHVGMLKAGNQANSKSGVQIPNGKKKLSFSFLSFFFFFLISGETQLKAMRQELCNFGPCEH